MDGHPNPPTITFPKRVGQQAEKDAVRTFALQTLNILAPTIDFTPFKLNIILTRANTGTTSGSLRTGIRLINHREGVTDLSSIDLMVNIDFNGRETYSNTIAHELVHYVQYITGALQNTAQMNGRQVVRASQWDPVAGRAITHTAHSQGKHASMFCFITDESKTMTVGFDEDAPVKTIRRSSRRSHREYMNLPWERQAHRLSVVVTDILGCTSEQGRQGYRKTFNAVLDDKCKKYDRSGARRIEGRSTFYW